MNMNCENDGQRTFQGKATPGTISTWQQKHDQFEKKKPRLEK